MSVKVCHVTSMHPAFDTRIFYKECISLAKKYEVYLVAAKVESQVKEGVHIIGINMPVGRIRKMLTTKPAIKAAISVDAEIYHIHDPELMLAGLKLKKKGKKVIFDYHENYSEFLLTKQWLPRFLRKPASLIFKFVESKALSKYDAIVSVTPFIVERLSRYNKNTYQITNYPRFQEVADKRRWGNSVCFVGGVVPEWMHYSIVKSLGNTDATYRLAGGVDPISYLNEMQIQPEWRKVNYVGKIQYEEVFPFMQQSSAGLAIRSYDDPNVGYKEGSLGVNKFFEYMMAGIPIIASASNVWKEIIEKYECGILVDPNDNDSISSAINYIISNPNEAKRMGDNGLAAAKQFFHWGTQESILFEMYEQLLDGIND